MTTMIPLLADPRTQEYDIIAVQEPWRNPHAATTLSSYQSGFHLLYRPGGDTKVCFYVNDRIDPDSWDVSYPSADLCSLAIKVGNGPPDLINIHNVYNPSPASYSSTDSPSTVPIAKQQLQNEREHILLGDFNLHHPYWSGPSRPTQHAAADTLLEAVKRHGPDPATRHRNVGGEEFVQHYRFSVRDRKFVGKARALQSKTGNGSVV